MTASTKALRVAFFAGVVLLLACGRSPEIVQTGCTWPPEVDAAWWALDDLNEECGYRAACWRDAIESARRLRDRYPTELMAHEIDLTALRMARGALPEYEDIRRQRSGEYREAAARHPANPAYPYLLSRIELDTPTRRKLLDEALRRDPDFARALLERVRQTPDDASAEEMARARDDFVAYSARCPERTTEILGLAKYFEDVNGWRTQAAMVRERTPPDRSASEDFPAIWSLEFARTAPTDHDAVRVRVRADIEKLRSEGTPDVLRLATLAQGYQMLDDPAGKAQVEDEILARDPCSSAAIDVWYTRESEALGPLPAGEAEASQWLEKAAAGELAMARRCPQSRYVWPLLAGSLARWDGAPAQLVEETADRVLGLGGPVEARRVTNMLIRRGVQLDRVPALIDANREWIDGNLKEAEARNTGPAELTQARQDHQQFLFINQASRVGLALVRKDAAGAELALAQLDRMVEGTKANRSEDRHPYQTSIRWKLRGQLDVLEGRNAEALEAFARSVQASPKDPDALAAARKGYAKLQGSDTGFEAWTQAAIAAAEEKKPFVRRPLPSFSLPDLAGKRWTLADLAGKPAFVNVWATWCGPCRVELPAVQKLHESAGGALVVTINIDDNPGLIEPYMKKSGFTFPVLVGKYAAYRTFSPDGIPQSFVVDPRGTIVGESYDLEGDPDRWVEDVQRALRAAATLR